MGAVTPPEEADRDMHAVQLLPLHALHQLSPVEDAHDAFFTLVRKPAAPPLLPAGLNWLQGGYKKDSRHAADQRQGRRSAP